MPTSPAEERQARLAKMQADQRNAERRRSFLVIGIAALLALVLIGVVVTVIVQSESERTEIEEQAAERHRRRRELRGPHPEPRRDRRRVRAEPAGRRGPPARPALAELRLLRRPGTRTRRPCTPSSTARCGSPTTPTCPPSRSPSSRSSRPTTPTCWSPRARTCRPRSSLSAWGAQLQLDSVDDERVRGVPRQVPAGRADPRARRRVLRRRDGHPLSVAPAHPASGRSWSPWPSSAARVLVVVGLLLGSALAGSSARAAAACPRSPRSTPGSRGTCRSTTARRWRCRSWSGTAATTPTSAASPWTSCSPSRTSRARWPAGCRPGACGSPRPLPVMGWMSDRSPTAWPGWRAWSMDEPTGGGVRPGREPDGRHGPGHRGRDGRAHRGRRRRGGAAVPAADDRPPPRRRRDGLGRRPRRRASRRSGAWPRPWSPGRRPRSTGCRSCWTRAAAPAEG